MVRETDHKNRTTNQKSMVTVVVWRPRGYMATTSTNVAFGVRVSNAFFPLSGPHVADSEDTKEEQELRKHIV